MARVVVSKPQRYEYCYVQCERVDLDGVLDRWSSDGWRPVLEVENGVYMQRATDKGRLTAFCIVCYKGIKPIENKCPSCGGGESSEADCRRFNSLVAHEN